jgi:hypothetical protein
MVFWHVERVKVVPLALKEGPFGKGEAHVRKNIVSLAYKARDRMHVAPACKFHNVWLKYGLKRPKML